MKLWRGKNKQEKLHICISFICLCYRCSFNCCPVVLVLLPVRLHHYSLLVSLFSTPTHSAYRLLPTMHLFLRTTAKHRGRSTTCQTFIKLWRRHHYTDVFFFFTSSLSGRFHVRSIILPPRRPPLPLFRNPLYRRGLSAGFIKITARRWLQPASLHAHPQGHLHLRPAPTSAGPRAKSRGHFSAVPWMSNETVRRFVDTEVLLLFFFFFFRREGREPLLTVALCNHI